MIPFAGWAATGTKWGGKIMKSLDNVGGVAGVMAKARNTAETVVRCGREAMDFLWKKGQETYSLIVNHQVVQKAKAVVEDISREYAEFKQKAADLALAYKQAIKSGVQVRIFRQLELAVANGDVRSLMKHDAPDYGNLKF